jgi:hypothetical protein
LCAAEPVLAQPPPYQTERIQAGLERFRARVEATARALDSHPRLKDLAQQQRTEVVEFVAGNTLFAIVHEMGHVLIGEMELPVLGREEDAADAHAVLVMLKAGNTFTHRVLVGAAKGWFVSDQRAREHGEKLAFYDEHGLDQQRAYQIVCLMVGSDPDKFADLARETNLPEARQGTCEGDYSNASWSWDKLLKPHLRTPDQPMTNIEVTYGEGKGDLNIFAQSFRSMRILEITAEVAAEEYVWRRPFTIEMKSCGQPEAHCNIPSHTLTVCYELAADFAQLYRGYVLSAGKGKRKLKRR